MVSLLREPVGQVAVLAPGSRSRPAEESPPRTSQLHAADGTGLLLSDRGASFSPEGEAPPLLESEAA